MFIESSMQKEQSSQPNQTLDVEGFALAIGKFTLLNQTVRYSFEFIKSKQRYLRSNKTVLTKRLRRGGKYKKKKK